MSNKERETCFLSAESHGCTGSRRYRSRPSGVCGPGRELSTASASDRAVRGQTGRSCLVRLSFLGVGSGPPLVLLPSATLPTCQPAGKVRAGWSPYECLQEHVTLSPSSPAPPDRAPNQFLESGERGHSRWGANRSRGPECGEQRARTPASPAGPQRSANDASRPSERPRKVCRSQGVRLNVALEKHFRHVTRNGPGVDEMGRK